VPEETPLEQARALVHVLDGMRETNVFNDRLALERMEGLHARLRPAWQFFLGGFPLVSSVTYPAQVWFPRIWEKAQMLLAQLEASPDWRPGDAVLVSSTEARWVPARLWSYVESTVETARRTNSLTDWSKVTREAALFLEHEIRLRSGLTDAGRQDLVAKAFKPDGGVLQMKADSALQKSWMSFVQGILGAFANPGAHMIRSHTETFAMGVVGAVSAVLTTMDDELGSLAEA
jgi:uncharacterized protein Ymh